MGRHRERVDIIADILKVANKGTCKTKIMFRANLSYTLLCQYLKLICACGLLNNGSKKYELTPKGKEFLKKYHTFDKKRKYIAENIITLNFERKTLEHILKPT